MSSSSPSILVLPSAAAWDAWLRANHDRSPGVFLRIPKKAVSDSTLTYGTALEAALAWGWIDGQKRALDETAWLQRFSRRTARSPWSQINRGKAEALIASIHACFEARSLFQWGIARREDDRVIGTCTLAKLDFAHRRAELGYALCRSA